MNYVTIDCAGIDAPRQLHTALSEALHFPQWYGANLDALYDCLTALPTETELTLLRFDSLPPFAKGFRRVLSDAEAANPGLTILFL